MFGCFQLVFLLFITVLVDEFKKRWWMGVMGEGGWGGGVFGGLFQLCENTLETQKKISKEHTLAFK